MASNSVKGLWETNTIRYRTLPPRLSLSTVLLAAASVAYVTSGLVLGFRPFDDTFITFRYSLHLASDWQFVFNEGERVLGTTSPLWAILGSFAIRLGIPLEQGSVVVSLLADVATAWLLVRLLIAVDVSRPAAYAGGLLFLTTFDAISLARSGMETSLFTMLVTATLTTIATGRYSTAGVTAGLAALTRPEGLILWPVALGVSIFSTGDARRAALRVPLVATLVVLPWLLFAWSYFGSPIPQSVLAKAAEAGAPGLARFSWTNLRLFFTEGQYGGAIFERSLWSLQALRTALAVVGLMVLARRGLRPLVLLAAFPATYLTALAFTHAFTWFPWYYGPLYAMLAWLGASGLEGLSRRFPMRRFRETVVAVLATAQVAVAVLIKVPADRDFWVQGYLSATESLQHEFVLSVAALEIGAVGWATYPVEVIDLAGLVTPSSVGVLPAEVLERHRPTFLIVRTDNAKDLLAALSTRPWFATEYERWRVVQDPYVDRRFEVYRRR